MRHEPAFPGLGDPWEPGLRNCPCLGWDTALERKMLMSKLQLQQQQQHWVGRKDNASRVLSHNNML